MANGKPNPRQVNPYDSKAYKRSNNYKGKRPEPRSVNPYSTREHTRNKK